MNLATLHCVPRVHWAEMEECILTHFLPDPSFSALICPLKSWYTVNRTKELAFFSSSFWLHSANRKPQHKISWRKEMCGKEFPSPGIFEGILFTDCSSWGSSFSPSSPSEFYLPKLSRRHKNLSYNSWEEKLNPSWGEWVQHITFNFTFISFPNFLTFTCFLFLVRSQNEGENLSMLPD